MFNLELTKNKTVSRNVVVSAIAAIAIFAAYSWIMAPHIEYLQAAEQYSSITQELVQKNKFLSSNIALEQKKLENLNADLQQLKGKIFDINSARNFFANIQNVAEDQRCSIHSLKFMPAVSASKDNQNAASIWLTANSASLTISGRYSDIVNFIEKIQKNQRYVWIDKLDIGTVDTAPDQLKCEMIITIYVIEDKETLVNGKQ